MVNRYRPILAEQKAGRFNLTEFLEARCTLDPETGCLIWKLAVPGDGTLRATVCNVYGLSVRRMVWQLMHPKAELGARRPYATCGNPLCVNPAHIKARTVKEAHQAAAKAGVYACPIAHAKRAAAARKRRTADHADKRQHINELRKQGKTYKQISEEVGVCWRDVGKVIRGEKWSEQPAAANSSVFSWRPAA